MTGCLVKWLLKIVEAIFDYPVIHRLSQDKLFVEGQKGPALVLNFCQMRRILCNDLIY